MNTIDFKMHPELLRSVIKKQAGTLDKAVLEGVMNSIDAGATSVNVGVTPTHVTIVDDGKGFRDAKEVEEFFATFGTPHEDGDATYGKFRMGRGQMFAFGKNTWRTGEYEMYVDVDKHLGFDLKQGQPPAPGCSISIELYEPLSQADIYRAKQAIEKMVKYVEVPIIVNGDQVSETPDERKFPQTTEDAYIKVKSDQYGGLDVYNLGVYVKTISSWQFGVSGTIVSRKQLDVNFARNDIMGKCPVWRRIKSVIDERGEEQVKQKKVLSDEEQLNVIHRLVSREMKPYEAYNIRFLKDTTGKAWSPAMLVKNGVNTYSVAERGSVAADRVMQQGEVVVFSQDCIDRFETPVMEVFKTYPVFKDKPAPDYVAFDVLSAGVDLKCTRLNKAKWSPREKAWQALIQRMMTAVCSWQYDREAQKGGRFLERRNIEIGISSSAKAWTDGQSYVAFARDYLRYKKMMHHGALYVPDVAEVLNVLIHELCHDNDSRDGEHSPDFYREYHDAAQRLTRDALHDIINFMTPKRYKDLVGGLDDEDEPEAADEPQAVCVVEPPPKPEKPKVVVPGSIEPEFED
jgi:hypothetical protein